MTSNDTHKNLAFISYSRRADFGIAAKLQRDLERYAIPLGLKCDRSILTNNRYIRPIFRDHTDLNLHNASWDSQLTDELRSSKYLLLICSPASATSINVNREVKAFLESHENDSSLILPIIVSGDVKASEGRDVCLPPSLLEHHSALIARNLPLARDCKGPELMLKVAAWILRVEYGSLYSQFRHQRTARRRILASVMFLVCLALSALGWKVWTQYRENRMLAAEKDRQEQVARIESMNAARENYLAKIRQAARSIGQSQLSTARQSLNECADELRDWEWHYLQTELDQSLQQNASSGAMVPVAVCPKGNCVAVLGPEHVIQIISLKDFTDLKRINTRLENASVIAMSSTGDWIAVGSWPDESDDGEVAVLEVKSGREVWSAKTGAVLQLDFSSDGSRLFASAPNYGAIQHFETSTGVASEPMLMGGGLAGRFAQSDSGTRIAAIDYDGMTLKLFSAPDSSELWSISISDTHHRLYFTDMDISSDGKYVLATTSGITNDTTFGGGIWLIDAATGLIKQKLGNENCKASVCRFSPGDAFIGVGQPDGTVEVFQFFTAVGTARTFKRYPALDSPVVSIAFRDEHELLCTGLDGVLRSQIVSYESPMTNFVGHESEILGMIGLPRKDEDSGVSPDSVSWSRDNTVRFWSSQRTATPRGRNQITITDRKSPVVLLTHSADGKHHVTRTEGGLGGSARLSGGREVDLEHTGWVADVAFSSHSGRVITGSLDRTAKVWNVVDGDLITALTGHEGEVYAVAINEEGTLAATGSADKAVHFWNCDTGVATHVLEGHTSPVKRVCISLDSRFAASGDEQGNVIVWNTEQGTQCLAIPAHHQPIISLCFSNRSDRLLTASADEPVGIWNLDDAAKYASLETTGQTVATTFGFSVTRIFTLGRDGVLGVWDSKHAELVLEVPLPTRQAISMQLVSQDSSLWITDIAGPTIRLSAPKVATMGIATPIPSTVNENHP